MILEGPLELTEEIVDQLFEAGCNDGTPGTSGGVFSIDFHREANSLEEAIHSAMSDVESAGTMSIASRLKRQRSIKWRKASHLVLKTLSEG